MSPREVVEALMRGISDGRWEDLDGFYADTAVIEYPFALPAPLRLVGRDEIRQYFAAAARNPLQLHVRDMVVHETTGRTFQVSNIQVATVRDGKIVGSRDYHNHVVLADVTGRLAAVIEALPGPGSAS
jgi:uncharacterized protein